MEIFKVKIVKCSNPEYWYKDQIGEEYTVNEWGSESYKIVSRFMSPALVFKSDCEIIGGEQLNNTNTTPCASNDDSDNPPVYPFHYTNDYGQDIIHTGMSLRDYFAAKALQGLLANPDLDVVEANEMASDAYRYADAMLKARESK